MGNSALAQFLLYIWLSGTPDGGDAPGLALRAITLERDGDIFVHTSPTFLDQSLDLFGAESVVAAVKRSLDQAAAREWTLYEDGVFNLLHALISRPQYLSVLTKIPLFQSLVQGSIDLWHVSDYRAITFWNAAAGIIRYVDLVY